MGENISNGTLYDRVEEKRGSLSKKELETAEYLAERAGSSEATVTGSAGNWDTGGFRH